MLDADTYWLIATAASVGFIHTLAGPDHYAPFVVMGAARGWSAAKTCLVTLVCGGGHLVGSVALGLIGIGLGLAVGGLEYIESVRGELAAWALLAFGLIYAIWGFRRAYRKKPHAHWHSHGGNMHCHDHTHFGRHVHVHDQPVGADAPDITPSKLALAPWTIFVIFVLGPCEPLIPVLMYPAITHSYEVLVAAVIAFAIATLTTMTVMTLVMRYGLSKVQFGGALRYGHSLAGGVIAMSGASMVFLGL